MTRQNVAMILGALLVVVANGFIGRFVTPNGILLTPVILTITTLLVVFGAKGLNPIWRSALVYLFVALNDILIKLYSGGSHDNEGLGWIHLLLFVGLLPTFGVLLTTTWRDNKFAIRDKIIGIVIFPILIIIHLYFLGDLGLGRYYQ
jgi:hypothetical protein